MLGRHVLEQEPGGPGLESRVDVLVEVERRQDHDPRRCARDAPVGTRWTDQPPGRLQAVETRHPDVHQHDVGPVAPGQPDRCLAVGGLRDDLDVRLRLEDHPEAGADQGLVVGDEDAETRGGHVVPGPAAATGSSGSHARTA